MNKSLFLAFLLLGLVAARGEEFPLWDGSGERGSWRAFGNGMLAAQAEGEALRLVVDWKETTYGVGTVFERPLPQLAGVRRLVVEARSSEANGTRLAPEWVAGEKTYRAEPERHPELGTEWAAYTFEVPADFPRLPGNEASVTALRLLFLNPDRPSQAEVYFRNARLEP